MIIIMIFNLQLNSIPTSSSNNQLFDNRGPVTLGSLKKICLLFLNLPWKYY